MTDPSNAVIAGAVVTLENEETGLTRTATTNEAGNYSFPDLPGGRYRVEVGVRTTNELQWLNPAAFTFDGYEIGTNGTAGRNICDGPGSFQADASLYKNIRLGPRVKLQLRFEVFNIFDTINFLGYSLNTGYIVDNVVFDTGDAATATKILGATPPGNFGQLTAARDPRTMQLGIRLMF